MVTCFCGTQTRVRTSWTNVNPGRRFHSCSEIFGTDCGFFDWLDPPMCAWSVQIIPGLLRSRNQLQESLFEMAAGRKRLKM
ncbi:zinc finger, GRF-type [Artemisia annua]|uniref:Zinc finger, GRF-type n=1 Tax=Artemisia annua TaxID=35608 RepID=A0A2U1K986_ARTAN|nr:zinc finger, GRF-type [Artemisia annua]